MILILVFPDSAFVRIASLDCMIMVYRHFSLTRLIRQGMSAAVFAVFVVFKWGQLISIVKAA